MRHVVILVSFLFFTALVAFATWLIVRKKDVRTEDGYFLAGRDLTFPFIAGSLLLTNLSTEQMVGLNGAAFKNGLSVLAWEVVAVVALVAMALFFLPKFLKQGVATVPQYLRFRFDDSTALLTNLIFLIAYTVILLPIILYTGATGLNSIMRISELTGIENEQANLAIMIFLIGFVGSMYVLFGGLRSAAVSDTLNGIGLLIGGFMILFFAMRVIGGPDGWHTAFEKLSAAIPDRLHSVGSAESDVPFATIFTGVLLINLFYWCTNQQIIQRTFGASSLAEGQKGVLLCGFLKLLGPLYLVLPGIMAYYMLQKGLLFEPGGAPALTGALDNPANMVRASDNAYGWLVSRVMPDYLTGFFAAVMVGAILSSFNSALNSTATLYSLGIYKSYINKNADQLTVVKSGRLFSGVVTLTSVIIAPLLMTTSGGIFKYLQDMNAIYFIPIFAVVLVGMISKRVPPAAAKWALVAGCVMMGTGYFIPPFSGWVENMNRYHFAAAVFAILLIFMFVWGGTAGLKTPFAGRDRELVNMTPWKHAVTAGALLLMAVVSVYLFFS